MRSLFAGLFALMALTAAAQVTLETRGQAETYARRVAVDEALEDLRDQVGDLHVTETMTLTAWLASRPDESLAVEQAIRDAEAIIDGSDGTRWNYAAEVAVGEINEALRPPSHRRVRESATRRLTGVGAAVIPSPGSSIDTSGAITVNSTQTNP